VSPVTGDTGRSRRRRALVLWTVGLACTVLVSAGFGLGLFTANLHNGLIGVSFTAVGLFVVGKRPGNREGWLFVATGLASATMFLARQYGLFAGERPHSVLPWVTWVTWLGVWPLPLVLVLTGVTLMCFPDGRLPSPRWRVVVLAALAVGIPAALASALWPLEYAENSLRVPHPLRTPGYDTAQLVWNVLGPASYLGLQVAWAVGVVVRMRRATGDEARRMRWFVYAVVMEVTAMFAGLLAFGTATVGVLAVPVIPVAAGVAIVKYRLYDIDLVISKTLVVGAMAAIVTAGYVAVVVGVGRLVGVAPGSNPALPIVATALVAVAFEPARRRVQQLADQLVYGHRPSPYEALSRLSAQLSGSGGHTDLFAGLASTVADSVGATEVALWIGTEDNLVAVASWPPGSNEMSRLAAPRTLASLDSGDRTHVRAIVHQGILRGAVTLTKAPGETFSRTEERLLHDLAAQAGLVIDHVGLGAELQQRLHQISRQAAELQAAAKRIVAAQYEARRRIERDLHDGAQQQLVTLALSLQTVSARAAKLGDDQLVGKVEEARAQLSQGLAELREMARGIHPAILTQEGLEAALSFLAERAALPVTVDVCLGRRLGQDVEATAYFVAKEALTNAAKHSGASRVTVSGRLHDDRLSIEVADDGRGGVDGRWGGGLQGLVDRLATLNGRLVVHSPAGGGTRLTAEIPCG
jgi:signal transduction histidine kinase